MKEIKCAVIGSGVIAPVHIESYQQIPGVSVKTLCDLIPEKAAKLAEKYAVPNTCTDYMEILNDPEIDCVSICTDHASHGRIAADAIDHGKHVLCEKCLTATDEQLQWALDAHKRHPEVKFSGIFQHRLEPSNILLKKMIEQGDFGKILTASLHVSCLRTNEYYETDPWRGTWAQEGGSVLINQSIHHFDLLRYFFGDIQSIYASMDNLVHQGVIETEDTLHALLTFKNGARVSFNATSGSKAATWRSGYFITGTEGYMEYAEFKPAYWKFTNEKIAQDLKEKFDACEDDLKITAGKTYYGTAHPAQIVDFIDAVRQDRLPFVTGEEAGETARAVHACYESAKTGKVIEL